MHSGKQQTWTREHIKEVGQALTQIQPPEQRLTKREALAELSPRLREMQRAGHALDQITEHLAAAGLTVGARTLKTYLRPSRGTAARGSAQRGVKALAPSPPSEPTTS